MAIAVHDPLPWLAIGRVERRIAPPADLHVGPRKRFLDRRDLPPDPLKAREVSTSEQATAGGADKDEAAEAELLAHPRDILHEQLGRLCAEHDRYEG